MWNLFQMIDEIAFLENHTWNDCPLTVRVVCQKRLQIIYQER
jgi:hypothetical protein